MMAGSFVIISGPKAVEVQGERERATEHELRAEQ